MIIQQLLNHYGPGIDDEPLAVLSPAFLPLLLPTTTCNIKSFCVTLVTFSYISIVNPYVPLVGLSE